MYDQPNAAALLKIARDTFLRELLPELPASKRYTGLMLANAMAIAERELAAGTGELEAELSRLGALYPDTEFPSTNASLNARLLEYNRRLAAEIRSGDLSGDREAAVRTHLRATTAARVAVSNPKSLKTVGGRR